jgi:hypothetical protein
MLQALAVAGPLLWEYWDEMTVLFLLAAYVRDQLQANRDYVGLERLLGWPFRVVKDPSQVLMATATEGVAGCVAAFVRSDPLRSTTQAMANCVFSPRRAVFFLPEHFRDALDRRQGC